MRRSRRGRRPFAGRAPSSGASPSCHGPPTCSTRPFDLDGALAQVAYLAIGVIADWCTVDLLTDGRIHHAAVAHRDPAMVARARQVKEQYPQDVDEPTFRHIITSLEPLFVEVFDDRLIDDTVPDPEYRRILREFQMSSFLVVPLVAGGKGIGIITLVGCHGRHRPRRRRARRRPRPPGRGRRREDPPLRGAHETAQVLQSSLLPASLPDIPGVTLSAHYRSGTEGLEIGGDFYDVFRTGRDRWWVVLGDVRQGAGRGSPHRGRPLHRARGGPGLRRRSRRAPRAEHRAVGPGRGGAVHQPGARDVPRLGHRARSQRPRPADDVRGLRRPSRASCLPGRDVVALTCSGTVVGLLPDIEIESASVTLEPGETLLFYTDGATEARACWTARRSARAAAALLAAHHDGSTADAPNGSVRRWWDSPTAGSATSRS